jgi:hypothetical protein
MLGLGVFFMRYIGLQDIGFARFLLNWYGGAAVATGLLVLTFRMRMHTPAVPLALSRQAWLRLCGGSLLILVAVGSAYGAYRLAPQTVVQPLFLVSEMVGPALIGLYVFGERETLARRDQAFSPLGSPGAFSWRSASASSNNAGADVRLPLCRHLHDCGARLTETPASSPLYEPSNIFKAGPNSRKLSM